MRINIESEGKKIRLALPSGLIYGFAFGRAGLKYLKRYVDADMFANMTKKDMKKIRKTLLRMRKIHKNWNVVEVDSSDGDRIKIRL